MIIGHRSTHADNNDASSPMKGTADNSFSRLHNWFLSLTKQWYEYLKRSDCPALIRLLWWQEGGGWRWKNGFEVIAQYSVRAGLKLDE